MGRTACTELQCLYNGALYLYYLTCFGGIRLQSDHQHNIYDKIKMQYTYIQYMFSFCELPQVYSID